MGFFGALRSKVEEVVGKVERTVGGAVGDKAMEFGGEAHFEHGEALLDKEERGDAPDDSAGAPSK